MRNIIDKAFTAAFLTIAVSSFSHGETLNEIYQQALQNDHQFRAAKAAYLAGKEEKNRGRAGLLPQVVGTANKTEGELEESGTRFNQPVNTDPADSESTLYQVVLTQPLFDMAAWHTYQRGKLDSKVAHAEYEAARQLLIRRVAEAYLNVLLAVDNFETARAEENANSHQLEQTRKRFEVGLTAITDVHEAQASYDNSLARRLLQEGNVGIAFEALEVITGHSYRYLAPLKEDFPINPPSPIDREEWVQFSMDNNFTLAAASLRSKSSQQSAKIARAGHLPTVEANLSYSDSNDVNNFSNVDRTSSGVSIDLRLPIFSSGGVSATRRQAAQRYYEAKENYLQARRDTIQNARSSHLTVVTDVATVKARRQAITSSQSALEATQAGYEVGTRDLVDVLIAQRTLYTAQRDYSDSLYTYIQDTLRLKEVAGILTEKDIVELDNWLDTSRQVNREIQ
ncbi:TolC family outer membrane protein [Agarilytica rhodophyticola]|uniref:TolC family outer membrane protein n=1 Tax=Agarilytica rhodophyticola TaxID=1737490 RepID=UPI000B349C9D|nr:TolC family outer membrane protein [Agarilytica rhodophyticola]